MGLERFDNPAPIQHPSSGTRCDAKRIETEQTIENGAGERNIFADLGFSEPEAENRMLRSQ